MLKILYCLTALFTTATAVHIKQAPKEIHWETLANVDFKKKWNETYKMNMEVPVFSNEIKGLNGKQVSIAGFLIPVTTYGNEYVISQNPYSGCYFCGNAGIESIIDLKFQNNAIRYKLDRYVMVKGTLLLNDKDASKFIYTLHNATEVK